MCGDFLEFRNCVGRWLRIALGRKQWMAHTAEVALTAIYCSSFRVLCWRGFSHNVRRVDFTDVRENRDHGKLQVNDCGRARLAWLGLADSLFPNAAPREISRIQDS